MYGEPVWDMLLDLYIQMKSAKRVAVTSLCIASRVAPTTAHRYIGALEMGGWIVREHDERDHRRSFLSLSASALQKMDDYIDQILDNLWQILPEALGALNIKELDRICDTLQDISGLLRERPVANES